MKLKTLVNSLPAWVSAKTAHGAHALWTQCSLARNLADFPYPWRCEADQKAAVEARILEVLDGLNLLAHGQYLSLEDLEEVECRFLAERQFIPWEMLCARESSGVYLSEDQQLCIAINGPNHLSLRSMVGGLQAQEAWAALNLMDDTLGSMLDFAFQARLGFLTTDLAHTGTGLKVCAVLHLPCLVAQNALEERFESVEMEGVQIHGLALGADKEAQALSGSERAFLEANQDRLKESLFSNFDGPLISPWKETQGDLFRIVSQHSLGLSEEEAVFKIQQAAKILIAAEIKARDSLLQAGAQTVEDRVGRGRGLASGAHLMDFVEGLSLFSSLRLGVETEVLSRYTVQQSNALLLSGQGAHLELATGCSSDLLSISRARADHFRRVVSL